MSERSTSELHPGPYNLQVRNKKVSLAQIYKTVLK